MNIVKWFKEVFKNLKKKLGLVVILLFPCVVAQADISETLKAIAPNTSPAMFYSVRNHEANFMTEYTLAEKMTSIGVIQLNAAYGESDTGLGVVAYKTSSLEAFGVDVVVLKDIFASVGYGVGYAHISKADRVWDHGGIVGLGANIKF